ncbi:MAG: GNAT family N-acetyltransferase [Lachnospiraceae bacterium]|nr:GNAT family N-acetyltransferase [Lachnospiraceae bacterium]
MEITLVNQENQKYFQTYIPPQLSGKCDVVLGAVSENGQACGVLAAAREEDELLSIRHIQVAEAEMGKGVGSQLLDVLRQIARESGDDAIYCQYLKPDGDDHFDRFLAKNGYEADEEKSRVFVITLQDLKPELFDTRATQSGQIRSLDRMTDRMWNRFTAKIDQNRTGENEGVELYPRTFYDQELSFLLLREQEPVGGLLFSRQEDGYVLEYMCMLDQVPPAQMMGLLSAAFKVIKNRGDEATPIYINALTDTTEKMIQRMTETEVKPAGDAVTRFLCL